MHGSKIIGAMIALLAGSLLLLTGWMMHTSGALQGATENGRWALGLAAIAVHLMLAVCGLAMFAARNVLVGLLCGVLMLGAAACSAWQISVFLATEVISVTKAREQADRRETARNAAALEMAKARQQTQAELLKDELKWSRGTSREVDGRRERKDLAETRAKMIAEVGKADLPVIPETKGGAPLRQDGALAQWVAARMGWDETATLASPYLLTALMILLGEVFLWPLASFFWNRPAGTEAGPGPVAPVGPAALEPSEPPPAVTAAAEPRALPAPVAPQSGNVGQPEPEPAPRVLPSQIQAARPKRTSWREPISMEARKALDGIDHPQFWQNGELRPKLPPKTAATHFALWLRAVGLHGQHSAVELVNHYLDFAEQNHREPTGYNQMASMLEARGNGVNKTKPIVDGKPTVMWVVTPEKKFRARAPKPGNDPDPAEQLSEAAAEMRGTEPERGGRLILGPFSVAGAQAGTPQMQPETGEPAWLHANRKAMRRYRIEQSRRQRGIRTGRRAA